MPPLISFLFSKLSKRNKDNFVKLQSNFIFQKLLFWLRVYKTIVIQLPFSGDNSSRIFFQYWFQCGINPYLNKHSLTSLRWWIHFCAVHWQTNIPLVISQTHLCLTLCTPSFTSCYWGYPLICAYTSSTIMALLAFFSSKLNIV